MQIRRLALQRSHHHSGIGNISGSQHLHDTNSLYLHLDHHCERFPSFIDWTHNDSINFHSVLFQVEANNIHFSDTLPVRVYEVYTTSPYMHMTVTLLAATHTRHTLGTHLCYFMYHTHRSISRCPGDGVCQEVPPI